MAEHRDQREQISLRSGSRSVNFTVRDVMPILVFLLLVAVLGFMAKEIILENRKVHAEMVVAARRLDQAIVRQNRLILFMLLEPRERMHLKDYEMLQHQLLEQLGPMAPVSPRVPTPSERWWNQEDVP